VNPRPGPADARVSAAAPRYDGRAADELAAMLGVPGVVLFDRVGSTLDVAHERAAAGAPAGTLVLADEQTAGRGRHGRSWVSEPGAGIWLTLVERPSDAAAVAVLSLRLGLHAARALERLAPGPVGLKWPNDLYVSGRKLAGILVEARWRQGALDWIAVGFGINVQAPRAMPAGALRPGVRRLEALQALVPALRAAAAAVGTLAPAELAAYAARDIARGRGCREPVAGTVAGIDATGALLVETDVGMQAARAGSLVLVEEA
jgi:BirA family biotin operon repressor/biotin-[acetyl-CoA-carboxylase] ligase